MKQSKGRKKMKKILLTAILTIGSIQVILDTTEGTVLVAANKTQTELNNLGI